LPRPVVDPTSREIKNFKPVPIEGFQRTIFREDGLTNGPHTITIEATNQ
jgi:hypothetical protein